MEVGYDAQQLNILQKNLSSLADDGLFHNYIRHPGML